VLPGIDWIGFDFKAPFGGYPALTGKEGSGAAAYASLDAVLASGVRHEIRTTVHPGLTPPSALVAMAEALAARGISNWVLQPFRAIGCANKSLVATAAAGEALDPALLARLARRIPGISVR
jgi:pyruvate formate lyase activating enzyme